MTEHESFEGTPSEFVSSPRGRKEGRGGKGEENGKKERIRTEMKERNKKWISDLLLDHPEMPGIFLRKLNDYSINCS